MSLPMHAVQAGFRDPIIEAQAAFRAVMQAMSRPGQIVPFPAAVKAPPPLSPEMATILLALADYETPVWLDARLSAETHVKAFLAFHTGAPGAPAISRAAFVAVSGADAIPRLSDMAQGSPEYPDRSATLLVQIGGFASRGIVLEGPGIEHEISFGFAGMPAGFADALRQNRANYPQGVDIIFTAPGAISALPRSIRVAREG